MSEKSMQEIKLVCVNNKEVEEYLTLNKLYVGILSYDVAVTIICDDGRHADIKIENIKNRFITQAEWREIQMKTILDE